MRKNILRIDYNYSVIAVNMSKYKIIHQDCWISAVEGVKKIRSQKCYVSIGKKFSLSSANISYNLISNAASADANADLTNINLENNKISNYNIALYKSKFKDDCYICNGISPRAIKKMQSFPLLPKNHIDLHGLNIHSAYDVMHQFIFQAYNNGQHYVYIIHGKGLSSKLNMPILKPQVLEWLKGIGIVLAFASAKDKYGGSGATVVMLKITNN